MAGLLHGAGRRPTRHLFLAGSGAIDRLETGGHSYATHTQWAATASQLGLTLADGLSYGVGGSTATSGLRAVANRTSNDQGPKGPLAEARESGKPSPTLCIITHLINDIAYFGAAGASFDAAMRGWLALSRTAPGDYMAANAAPMSYSAGWAGPHAGTDNTFYCTNNGPSFTWTTPVGWAGGWLNFVMSVGVAGWGATHTFTVDGAVGSSFNTVGYDAGLKAHRMFLGAGAGQVVSCVVSGMSVATYVHGWAVERAAPPLVVLVKAPRPFSYAAYGAPAAPFTTLPSDALLSAGNARLEALAAEYGSYVITADPDPLLDADSAMFIADGLHPNAAGEARIASSILRAIKLSGLVSTEAL